jgi:hypothetical protein
MSEITTLHDLRRELEEARHTIAAIGHEKDELRARAEGAEHRRAAAEYRAQRIVLDAELQARAEAAERARDEAIANTGKCDCGEPLTVCEDCAVGNYQAAHTECETCCPVRPAP